MSYIARSLGRKKITTNNYQSHLQQQLQFKSKGTPINWVAFGAHIMKQQIMSKKTKQQATKVKSNKVVTKASLNLKERVPLSPKVLPNILQIEECMQDLVTLCQIKIEKKKPFSKSFLQHGSKYKPPSLKTLHHPNWSWQKQIQLAMFYNPRKIIYNT